MTLMRRCRLEKACPIWFRDQGADSRGADADIRIYSSTEKVIDKATFGGPVATSEGIPFVPV